MEIVRLEETLRILAFNTQYEMWLKSVKENVKKIKKIKKVLILPPIKRMDDCFKKASWSWAYSTAALQDLLRQQIHAFNINRIKKLKDFKVCCTASLKMYVTTERNAEKRY